MFTLNQIYKFSLFKPAKDIAPALVKKVGQLNIFLVCTLFFVCMGATAYYFQGLQVSLFINLTYLSTLLVCYWLNRRGMYETAKILSCLILNVYLVSINYAEGLKAGNYLFYFPYLFSLTFLTRLNKMPWQDILIYLLTIAGILLVFFGVTYKGTVQTISVSMYITLHNYNIIFSLLSAFTFSYITLRHKERHEDLLLEQQQFFDAIYNTSSDAVLVVDAIRDVVVDCNEQTKTLFSLSSKKDIIGKDSRTIFDMFSHSPITNIKRFQNEKHWGWTGEVQLMDKAKHHFIGLLHVINYHHKNKRYKKISITDITQQKTFEKELLEAREKAEVAATARLRFLSTMSHELRTPLNGIIGMLNLLMDGPQLPQQLEPLQILKFSSKHMLELVNDLLDLNKIEADKMVLENRLLNLGLLIADIKQSFKPQYAQKGIGLNLIMDNKLFNTLIESDSVKLNQVLNNLLSNALKFTAKGSVSLQLELLDSTDDLYTVRFSVTDTGIGIADDKKELIFDSFTQANPAIARNFGGTGLGLTISKKLLALMGGKLTVDSQTGLGSTFSFTLPFKCHGKVAQPAPEKTIPMKGLNGKTILVAEDNPVNMLVARKFLQQWGAKVLEAQNGEEAVKLAENNPLDLMLLDLDMPIMDGFEAIAAIRHKGIGAPALMFTAALVDANTSSVPHPHFDGFVFKPFQPQELYQKLMSFTSTAVPA
jgi:signal transduction histidine kinase/CheY-like chemotaxis protein